MGMVARPQGIASAYVVFFGVYGDVTRQRTQRDASRQKLYREATQVAALLEGTAQRANLERLQEQGKRLQKQVADAERDLRQAVVIDEDRIARFAAEAQAEGVSLPTIQGWLQRLLPERAPIVATLGRSRPATAAQVQPLLPLLTERTR